VPQTEVQPDGEHRRHGEEEGPEKERLGGVESPDPLSTDAFRTPVADHERSDRQRREPAAEREAY